MTVEIHAKTEQGWLVQPNFEIMQFPGGEWHIKDHDTSKYVEYYIVVRGASPDDIFISALVIDLMRSREDCPIHMFMPYIPAARADRGNPFGAKVYSDIIQTLFVDSITVLDPHSEVARSLYSGPACAPYYEMNLPTLVRYATTGPSHMDAQDKYVGIIAPDKGAHDRAKTVAATMHVPTYFAFKERDFETGKLKGFSAPENWENRPEGKYLVVDDICDGGGTFMGLAEALGLPKEQLDLWITHGIFSGNPYQLWSRYGNVYTTDSHPGALKFTGYEETDGNITTIYRPHVIKLFPRFIQTVKGK